MVMEYLEGETLSARLDRGALPIVEALKLALQIADALDRAHRSAVVHRDVKPSNIMLTRDGAKLLDFGLAKTRSDTVSGTTAETIKTSTAGTPEYMAPERFGGAQADERCDIFAFGCVLYEMVTGRPAYRGENLQSVMATILSKQLPPMDTLQRVAPPLLERFVRRCLANDPEDRWQSMRDVVLELRSIAEGNQYKPPLEKPGRRQWLPRIVLGTTVLTCAVVASFLLLSSEQVESYQFEINPPEGSRFLDSTISPDGSMLAFVAATEGKSRLWLRRLDSRSATLLDGTEGAYYPFWSPDSRFVGFFTYERLPSDKLKKIDISGGPPRTICDVSQARGGTWNADGVILFSAVSTDRTLHRVSSNGGSPVPVTHLDASVGEKAHYWPYFLPDGRHFLYLVIATERERTGIRLAALDSDSAGRVLVSSSSNALYAPARSGMIRSKPGHLLFMRKGVVMAQSFDAVNLELKGPAFPVLQDIVGYWPGNQYAAVLSFH